MPDRSKAQLLRSSATSTAPASGIKDGDMVRIDTEHAGTLRAAKAIPAGRTSPVERPAGGGGGDEIQSLVRRGDRYYDDKHYAQAVDYYQKAAAIRRDAEVLNKLADAHVRLSDIYAAETVYEELIDEGLYASLHVVHVHAFSFCEGELRFERSRVSYAASRGNDAFEITPESLVAIEPGTTTGATTRNVEGIAIAYIVQDNAGKRKKYTVYSDPFAGGDPSSLKERTQDSQKMARLLERLTKTALK
jgi:tetratricopeptide (TPR) repeat protein